jgi:ATP-dependent Clp protease ATP-binding subunit ClpA
MRLDIARTRTEVARFQASASTNEAAHAGIPDVVPLLCTARFYQAVDLAQNEAKKLGHNHVSPDHILFGVVGQSESAAIAVLDHMGISRQSVRSATERRTAWEDHVAGDFLQLTPYSKHVINFVYVEAQEADAGYVGTQHLLVGLVKVGAGVMGEVFSELGIDLDRMRAATRLVSESIETERLNERSTPDPEALPVKKTLSNALIFAQEEADSTADGLITPAHLFLGLAREGDWLDKLLSSCGASAQLICAEINQQLAPPAPTPVQRIASAFNQLSRRLSGSVPSATGLVHNQKPGSGHLIIDAALKQKLTLARYEAHSLGSKSLGPEHLLLAVLHDKEFLPTRVLSEFDVDIERVRRHVVAIQSHPKIEQGEEKT